METTKQPLSAAKKRYATYLRPESIKALQRIAFERAVPDYDVVQAAVDEYLRKNIPIRLPISW